MGERPKYYGFLIALLTLGSAISLFSCGKAQNGSYDAGIENLITRTVDSMEVISTKNGKPATEMRSVLVHQRALAKDPYEEHPHGIEFISYDSLGVQSLYVISDYALHWTNRDFWQLEGNVVVVGDEGQKLSTQQLMWDRKIKKIYSNVDLRMEEGSDVSFGAGFEAADDMSRWTIRELKGTVGVEVGAETEGETEPATEHNAATVSQPAEKPPLVL